MITSQSASLTGFRSWMLVLALFLGNFLNYTFSTFLSNVLVNVASSVNVTVGTASQIMTILRFASLIMGLLMGFLAVKFKSKSLFLVGVALYGVGALGCFFVLDFASLLFFNLFLGIGAAMISIMMLTLVGEHLPLQKRGFAIGLVVAGAGVSQILTPQVTSLISNDLGWRAVILWYILPVALVVLLISFFVIPSKSRQEQTSSKPEYLKAFKQILTNKSAIACVVGSALLYLSFDAPVYAVTFYRLHFTESLSMGAIFYSLASATLLLGSLIGGRLINRIGRKRLSVMASAIQGIFTFLIVIVPNEYASVAMWMVSTVFAGAAAAAFIGLALEQVPGFRGTMMSLNSAFRSIGLIVGLSLGGLLLNLYANNFQIIYAMFGVSGVASAAVVFLFAKDPCINPLPLPV